MRRALLAVVAFVAAVLVPSSPAWAHAALVAATPDRDATLTGAPATITLKFSERLNPDFTTIVLSDASRHPIPAAPPAISSGTGTLTPAQPLGNGTYTVAYRVVSVDGHTVQGSYQFTVADPALPPASAAPSAAAAAPRQADSGGLLVGGLIVVGVLLAAGAIYLVVTRRRGSLSKI